MNKNKTTIKANSNIHHMGGKDILLKDDVRFKEYRKRWKENPETFFSGDFPLFIDIEVTSACNLQCPFCATTFRGDEIERGFLATNTLKKIIDEGSEKGLYGVKFNIRGEPLLHPEIHNFVKYAKDKGLIDVYFNTNGMLLDREMTKKLIEAGLDRVSVSFEGYTKEVYEKYRVGGRYETVLENIKKLQEMKKDFGVEHPKLRVQTVFLEELKDDFYNYKKFWEKIADEVSFLDYKEMKDKKKNLHYSWACPQLWQRMAIWWDGTILLCNHDDDGILASGNIKERTIASVWNSEETARIRETHRRGDAHEVKACDGCYLRDSEIEKLKHERLGNINDKEG